MLEIPENTDVSFLNNPEHDRKVMKQIFINKLKSFEGKHLDVYIDTNISSVCVCLGNIKVDFEYLRDELVSITLHSTDRGNTSVVKIDIDEIIEVRQARTSEEDSIRFEVFYEDSKVNYEFVKIK